MAYDGRYDDPKYINAFLASMRADDKEEDGVSDSSVSDSDKENQDINVEPFPCYQATGDADTPAVVSAGSSPPSGIRAPPPTPESAAATGTVAVKHLPPIQEDSDKDFPHTEAPTPDPKAATKISPTAPPFYPSAKNCDESSLTTVPLHSLHSLHRDDKQSETGRDSHWKTLAKLRELALTRINHVISAVEVDKDQDTKLRNEVKEIVMSAVTQQQAPGTDIFEAAVGPNGSQIVLPTNTETFHDAQDDLTAIVSSSGEDSTSIDIIVDAPETPDPMVRSRKSDLAIVSPIGASKESDCSPRHDEGAPIGKCISAFRDTSISELTSLPVETPVQLDIKKEEESREDALYFPTWGTPTSRKTGPAHVRTIVLSNLPANADYTLAQALVHGGAVETMSLSRPSTATSTAHVTFANAEACDAYYKHYPNGIEFKYQGTKQIAFVGKGQNVNVISGILQTYLDCGATRVVKVSGVDEDWTLRALYKTAEGDNKQRTVEAVIDNYHNRNRTVTFRFIQIADAVHFRSHLLRHPDWQYTDIQFGSDPCEKAAGIHLE